MYWNITEKDRLIEAISLADNPILLKQFLATILTEKEMEACAVRLTAMCMLHDMATYKNVHQATGLSSATIVRLAKTINDRESAFHEIIKRFKKKGPAYFD